MGTQLTVGAEALPHVHEDRIRRRVNAPRHGRVRNCRSTRTKAINNQAVSSAAAQADALTVQLLPLVRRVALQTRLHLPAHVELDDLIAAGTIGLIDAVRKYDASKGITIESYARYRIRGAILDSLREQDPASRDSRRKIKKIEAARRKIEIETGSPAEDPEIAAALGMSLSRWQHVSGELRRLGYDGPGSNIFQEPNHVDEENIADECGDDPFTLCYRREQKQILARALGSLGERDRAIMNFYYQEMLTMKQIADRLGIDESRVSQLHSGAVARLRVCVQKMTERPASHKNA